MSLHDQARSVLEAFQHDDPRQQQLAGDYLTFLDTHDDGVWRDCSVGHITASALVMDASGDQVLLTLHPKVGRWLQLGGHLEPGDDSIRAGAVREVIEESGLGSGDTGSISTGSISTAPIRLDRHRVPCGRGSDGRPIVSEHLDIQYVVVFPTVAPPTISAESDDLRWFARTRLPDLPGATADESVLALIDDATRYVHSGRDDLWVSFG